MNHILMLSAMCLGKNNTLKEKGMKKKLIRAVGRMKR